MVSVGVSGQGIKTLFYNSPAIPCSSNSNTVEVKLQCRNLNQIVGFKGSMNWDTTKFSFNKIDTTGFLFSQGLIYNNLPDFLSKGILNYIWVNSTSLNTNFSDSTTLITVTLNVLDPNIDTSKICFYNNYYNSTSGNYITTSPEIARDSNGFGVHCEDTSFLSGTINFYDTVYITQSGGTLTANNNCNVISYQWYKNNIAMQGATSKKCIITSTDLYKVKINYANGSSVTSIAKNFTLPLKLLSFSAQKENNNVLLNWQTANEVNVSHFNIQRSFPEQSGVKDFITIGNAKAQNKSSNEYSFYDSPPVEGLGVVYYRIQSIDFDGKTSYSETRTINLKPQTSNSVSIYPNPAKDFVSVECKGAKELMIVDYLGRVVFQSTSIRQQLTVNTKQFNKGVYIVKVIMNNGDVKTEKLIVE